MDYLPLFHNLRGRTVLVVGGGEVALRKARLLADAGACLRVVAPEVREELQQLAAEKGGQVLLRGYVDEDLADIGLIIAATDDEPLNARISAQAQARGIPVNVVDAPALCSVIFPAIVEAMFNWASAFYQTIVRAPGAEQVTLAEHTRIYEAIAARDPDASAMAMHDHLTRANVLYRAHS